MYILSDLKLDPFNGKLWKILLVHYWNDFLKVIHFPRESFEKKIIIKRTRNIELMALAVFLNNKFYVFSPLSVIWHINYSLNTARLYWRKNSTESLYSENLFIQICKKGRGCIDTFCFCNKSRTLELGFLTEKRSSLKLTFLQLFFSITLHDNSSSII